MSTPAISAPGAQGSDRAAPVDSLAAALRALAREEWADGRDGLCAVVAQRPDDARGWAFLSGAHLALAEVHEAQAASARALELDPDGFLPRLKAGELAFRLGDLRAAEAQFLVALRAVEPGTREAAAARRALAIVRTRLRSSITHGASLPRVGFRPGSLLRPPFAWLRRRRQPLEEAR
jgi:tetratricopeptide (TPR) repeat protein